MKYFRKISLIVLALLLTFLIGINMYNSQKTIWFEGSNELDCKIERVESSVNDLGEYFLGIISKMPSMTKVDLVEKGEDFVTLQTNEGLMKRTNISKKVEGDKIMLEFDEEYQAGMAITTKSHFLHEFEMKDNMVIHHITISNLEAPGFMGFFYRNFGSSTMGKAFLNAHKNFLEKESR